MRRKARWGGGGGGEGGRDLGAGRHAEKGEGRKKDSLPSFLRTYPVLVILNSPVTKPATAYRKLKSIFSL